MSTSRQYRLYIWYMILDQITSVFDLKVHAHVKKFHTQFYASLESTLK
jgi:hypothetical protein